MENNNVSNPVEEPKLPEEAKDNLELANQIFENLFEPFSLQLEKLSTNQLKRVIKALVRFPFIDVTNKTLKDESEKTAFMFGERIIYANMVKRARIELDSAFEQAKKEEDEIKNSNNPTDTK